MSPHILSGRHHHDDDEFEVPLSENWLWKSNNFSLVSAGIDIGSSSTLVLLMRINIKKSGSGRYAKFKVVSRELVYESPVNFTPYKHGGLIDSEKIRKIISAAFSGAGVTKDSIDVGALILTGEAMRSENSSEIGRSLSLDSGRFISVNAGHKLESVLAAHGSGAVDESIRSGSTVLNIDIGGGTTKYALVSRGQILASWAISIGGRLVLFNRDGFVEKVTTDFSNLSEKLGFELGPGSYVSVEQKKRLATSLADIVMKGTKGNEEVLNSFPELALTEFPDIGHYKIDGVMVSGGVGEFVYNASLPDFGDIGRELGMAVAAQIDKHGFRKLIPRSCLRATVAGVSGFTMQVSGNTIYCPSYDGFPLRNLPVIHIHNDDEEPLNDHIREKVESLGITPGRGVVLMFHWDEEANYSNMISFVKQLKAPISDLTESGGKVVLVTDGDIAQSLGHIMEEEGLDTSRIICLDGISLNELNFVDIGNPLDDVGALPVTVKSLDFNWRQYPKERK